MTTLFLKDFTVLDFAKWDPNFGLQGESWYISAELEGELDHQGFIFDFAPAKKLLKTSIDDFFDHKFLIPSSNISERKDGISLGKPYFYKAPKESYAEFPSTISLNAVERELEKYIFPLLPSNIFALRFFAREEARFQTEANFRYTHGLRLHEGNCQRLFHGHRNPIEVWIEGKRERDFEYSLAKEWDGVHFAHKDTLINRNELDLPLRTRRESDEIAKLYYRSPQGEFLGKIPASKIFLMEFEPSIENIARTAAELLRSRGVKHPIKIVAYEGLNKGASFSL